MTRTEFVQKMASMGATREQIKSGLQRRRSEIGLFDDEIDDSEIGSVASKYESNNNPSVISSGEGDIGGKSYGSFQLSTETGTLKDFLDQSGYSSQFQGTIGSSNFDKKWKELSQNQEFNSKQKEYIVNTHYKPVEDYLKSKYGLDISQSKAVKELVYSTANQFGAGNAKKVLDEALSGKTELDEKSFIDSVTEVKLDIDRWFKSSPIETRQSVKNRFVKEREDLYSLITPQTEQVTEQPTEQVVTSSQEQTPEGNWTTPLKGAIVGLKDIVSGIIGGVASINKIDAQNKAKLIKDVTGIDIKNTDGKSYDATIDKIKEKLNFTPEMWEKEVDKVASDPLVSKNIPQMINTWATMTTTNLPQMVTQLAGNVGSATLLIARETDSYLEEAKKLGVPEEVAQKYAMQYAIPSGISEYADNLLMFGKNVPGVKQLAGTVKNKIASKLIKEVGAGTAGGGQEVLQSRLLQYNLGKAAKEAGISEDKLPKQDYDRDFWSGFGIEIITRGAGSALSNATNRQQQTTNEDQTPIPEVMEQDEIIEEPDESPVIESFDMTKDELMSRYDSDPEGRKVLRSAVTTDNTIDENTKSEILSEMDQIDNTIEEVTDEEEQVSQETETLLNTQEPAVEPQSSQEATTPISTDLPSVETVSEQLPVEGAQSNSGVPMSTSVATEGTVQTPPIAANIEEEQVSNPVTSPSYITKRDDGTVIVDKRNITDNKSVASILNSYKQNEFTVEDIKNIISKQYDQLNKVPKSLALLYLNETAELESVLSKLDNNIDYITKDQFVSDLKKFKYTKKQIDVVNELVNNLKFDKFPKITNEKLLGKGKPNNFYVFAENILSSDSPDALMHEIGHFSFYNVLSSSDRINFMKYVIEKFNESDNKMDDDLSLKNVIINENTFVKSNASDNFDEYFAEQFRQYVIENKVTDSQFKTLFSRLKEYLDAVLQAFRKTGYNKDLVKYFDKIIDSKKNNVVELSQDQKKFISRLDIPENKLSVAKEIVKDIDFSVPYQNKSEEASLGPKFKRLIRIISDNPDFSINVDGKDVSLREAVKGKTRQQMAEIADIAGFGTELESQGVGSTMKKQERRQVVESITNGMEYTPKLEQQIKKEFSGNKDFSFDKIFEVVTGDISKREQNRIYKEGTAKGLKGEKLTKYMSDEMNKLSGRKVLLIKNPEKFAVLQGENVQNVDAKDIDIIYDKDVIDDKIKANVTEVKKKRKPPKQYTQQEKEESYIKDWLSLKNGSGNVKVRFYDFINKYLYGAGADSYRRQIFDMIEEMKDNSDPLVDKAMGLIDEAIEFRKVSKEFTKLKAFTRKKTVKSNLKENNSDMIAMNKRVADISEKYQQFVDYQTIKRLKDRGGEVLKPKVVADTVRRLRGSDKYVVVNKETNKITTSERFDTKEAAREWINDNSEKVSSKIGAKYDSVINQGLVKPISKTDKKRAQKLGLSEDTQFDFYEIIKTDDVKKKIANIKAELTDSNGKMFDAENIRIEVTKIKEDYKAIVSKKEVVKITKDVDLEKAVDDIGKQLKAKKRTEKQTKAANFWSYRKNSKANWLSPVGLVGVNFRYKNEEMDGYKDGFFQKYIIDPMTKNRHKVYENKNKLDDGLKEDIRKSGLTYKDIRRMSDQVSVGTAERLVAGDKKKRTRKVKFEKGEIEMSEAREVSLYLLSRNERGYKHLTQGGVFIETDKIRKNPFIFTEKDILGLEKRLNSRQKKLVKVIISHFKRQSDIGNEVSLADIGEKIFNEPNYFPFSVETDYIDRDTKLAQTPDEARQIFFKGLPSITKERQNSGAPIILEDPFIAVARTSNLFNKYMDMVMVTNKVWTIIDNSKFRDHMINNGYQAEYDAMRDDIRDIMMVKPKDSSEDLLKMFSSIFTVSVLGYKPSVALSQPIATVLYFPEMDIGWREFAKNALDIRKWLGKVSIKELYEFRGEIEKESEYLKERFNSSMEVIRRGTQNRATAADMFLGGKKLGRDTWKFLASSRGAMSWIQNMDTGSIMGIWKLCEIEAIGKGYKRGTAEFKKYVAERTEYITQMTQQTFDSLDSPPLSRSAMGKLITRFLSQSLKSGMMLRKQMYRLYDKELSFKDKTKAGLNALGIILSQSVAVELLKVGIKAVGGGFEDDEWMTLEYWGKSLSTNILTLFGAPGIILGGILGGYGNVGGGNFGALTERIGDAKKKLTKAINDQDGDMAIVAIYELAKTFLPIGGPEQAYEFAVGLVEMWGIGR